MAPANKATWQVTGWTEGTVKSYEKVVGVIHKFKPSMLFWEE